MLRLHNLVYMAHSGSSVFLGLSLFREVPGPISILRAPLVSRHVSFLVTSVTGDIASCLAPGVGLKASLIVLKAILGLTGSLLSLSPILL